MQITAENLQSGIEVSKAIQNAVDKLARVGINKIDYFSLRDPITLEPLSTFKKDARLLVALYVGATRLIDNIAVSFVQSGTINSEYNQLRET
jgi:pantoate--beta-alanine ligase